eukprot:9774515-Heterocapsa_arctica.AAC.1
MTPTAPVAGPHPPAFCSPSISRSRSRSIGRFHGLTGPVTASSSMGTPWNCPSRPNARPLDRKRNIPVRIFR